MKEIDTEAPIVWPAWCYSGNITTNVTEQSHAEVRTLSSSSSSSSSLSSPEIVTPTTLSCKTTATLALTADLTSNVDSVVNVANRLRTKRKSHFSNKQLFTESVGASNFKQDHQIVKKNKETNKLLPALVPDQTQNSSVLYQPQQIGCKAAVPAFHTEKMLSDRMLLSGYNAIESNKQLCDSSSSPYLFLEKVKNETQMESLKDSELTNHNNVNNSNNNNNPSNNNNNNNTSNNNSSVKCSTNNTSSVISNNNSNSNSNTSNNSVKRERLSPGTNGDAQFSLSRSRSATPLSFRGTPPQTAHSNNDSQLHNLSTNLLTQIQSRTSDFSTRNYSDFMRSLAAKYNNSNPNDSGTSRRNPFFESSKISQPIKSSTNSNTNNGAGLKDQTSPTESVKSAQNIPNLTTTATSIPPFVQTFLSSLPFSPGVFPPLIDMSSTQALVTLARAAKEAEIKSILMSAQKRTSLSNNTTSNSPAPNLNAALQQAAQFASPALLYSAQLQQQQQQQQSQNRQSSQNQETSANSSGEKHMTASPLDLSSAPPTKRYKAESTSSGGSDKSPNPDNVPGTSGTTIATPASSPKVKTTAVTVTSEASVTAAMTIPTPVLPLRQCQAQSDEVNGWTVEDVCSFVGSIDICVMYVKNFQEQCIDGSGLPLLTEDHLMNQLGMKLGPALKLKSMLAKKLGGPCPCVSCSSQAQLLAAAQAAAVTVATSSTSAATMPTSGITGSKNQPHPQQHQHQTQQFNTRNSATCNDSISHNTAMEDQRTNSFCGSTPRPSSADSGS